VTLQSHGATLGDDELAQEIRSLAPWFHNLHLPGGRQTAPDHPLGDFPAFKWEQLAQHLPEDLSGLSVLDIGCNAGFYALRLAARGARVLGVDVDDHYLRQARWARVRFGFGEDQIALRRMQVYELARLEQTFDIVLFMGVLYHLRYPLLALDIVAGKVGGRLILQTLTMPGEAVLEAPEELAVRERALDDRPDVRLQVGLALTHVLEKLEEGLVLAVALVSLDDLRQLIADGQVFRLDLRDDDLRVVVLAVGEVDDNT